LEISLEHAGTAVGGIDPVMGRAKDGPGSIDHPQSHGVDHSQAPNAEVSVPRQRPTAAKVSSFSRALASRAANKCSASKLGGLKVCKLARQGVVTLITQTLLFPLSELIEVLSEPQPAGRINQALSLLRLVPTYLCLPAESIRIVLGDGHKNVIRSSG
jgi:hypothetical protein